MFDVALYQPEIPPNTGNIIRLCANVGSGLHLIHPLGFELDDRRLRRAGLDYHEWAQVREYGDWTEFLFRHPGRRILPCSTRGGVIYSEIAYRSDDMLLFGPETRGLPDAVLHGFSVAERIRIPMRPGIRSLNLSNAVAVIVYEAWRQLSFRGAREKRG